VRLSVVIVALAAAACEPAAAQPAKPAQATFAERFEATCVACHGAGGHSTTPGIPSLAGQPGFYAITQLFLFREARRDNVLMNAVAKGMSNDDMRGFADHIATLAPPPPPAEAGDALRLERGRTLAVRHHCVACHGGDFSGGKQVPRLANQREDYLKATLHAFRSAGRIGYTQAMNEALAGLTGEQLDDLAHYLAHVPAPPR
jgi:cytochrome c553